MQSPSASASATRRTPIIHFRLDDEVYATGVSSCKFLQFPLRHFFKIATYSAFRAAKGNIHEPAFLGHPHG